MKTKVRVMGGVILTILFAVFITACGKGNGNGGEGVRNKGVQNIGNVVGTVTDSTTGESVADVDISIGDKTGVADSAGIFTILDIPEGSQSITVSKSGYKTYSDTVSVEKDKTIIHDVSLLGPVAYYPFNGNANDESGNGNDGIVSGATLTIDRFGNPSSAYNFNGTGDYIKILQSETLNNLQTATISYWVKYYKPTSGSNNVSVTITNGSDKPTPFVDGFFTYAGKDGIGHYLGKWADSVGVMVPIDATIPHEEQEFVFVTFVADVDTIKIYKNGVLMEQVARENRNISRPNEDWFIGTNGTVNLPYYLNGVMDDIRIYNLVLSESEIQMLYNSGN